MKLLQAETYASSWTLLLTVITGGQQRQVYVKMSQLDRLNLERISDCIYESAQERKQVSCDLRQMVALARQDPALVVAFPAQSGWSRTPDLLFSAGRELLPSDSRHPAQAHMGLCGEPVRIAAPEDLTPAAAIPLFAESLLEHPEYRIPAFAYTIMPSLRSLWCEADLPFACTLYIMGKSGTGKSTLARNFCQLYNNEDGLIADCHDAKSSVPALETVLDRVRDRTVLFDDLCRSSDHSDQRKRRDSATNLLRFVANEVNRSKRSGQETADYSCKAGLVITAEFPLCEVSELTRCILLQITKPRIGGTSRDREVAAVMLKTYLSWFAAHEKEEWENLRANRTKITTPRYAGQERLWGSVMQLNWCAESLLRCMKSFCPQSSTITPEDLSRIFRQLFEEERQFILSLQEQTLPLAHHIREGILSRQLPGFGHKGAFCVRLEPLVLYLQRHTKRSDISEHTVSSYLRENELVHVDRSNRLTKKLDGRRYVFLNPFRLGLIASSPSSAGTPAFSADKAM